MARLPFKNSFDYLRGTTYFDAISPASKNALLDIILEDDFHGATDPQALGLLYSVIANNTFSKVLQLGTWMGYSTIVLADALNRSLANTKRPVWFDTVEADKNTHERARLFIDKAGLSNLVNCLDGSSLSIGVQDKLQHGYDLIYIDSSHTYKGTKEEIDVYYPRLNKGGYIFFHDSSEHAAQWDPSGQGGVRKALKEWVESTAAPAEFVFFEKPFWLSECGVFLAHKS